MTKITTEENATLKADVDLVWYMARVGLTPDKEVVAPQRKIADYMPILEKMFPGINYYSISGFSQVMKEVAMPCVAKTNPDLAACATSAEAEQRFGKTVDIAEIKPSAGYEWQDNYSWRESVAAQVGLKVNADNRLAL